MSRTSHQVVAPVEVDPVTVRPFVEALAAPPAGVLVEVDCSAVAFMDSAGVRALTMAAERQRAAGGDLRVVRPSGVVRRILEITALSDLIEEGASQD